MKIVFLDFDGVVRSGFSDLANGRNKIDPSIASVLFELQKELNLTFVCSSRAWAQSSKLDQEQPWIDIGFPLVFHEDWRTPYESDYTEEDYEEMKLLGSLPDDPIYDSMISRVRNYYPDKTLWECIRGWRGFCIQSWLDNHPDIGPDDYVVLDDETDMYPLPRRNFIHVENGELNKGLGWNEVLQIIEFFKDEDTRTLDHILGIKRSVRGRH